MQVLTTNEDSIFVENIHKVSSQSFEHTGFVRVCMYACLSVCVYMHVASHAC